MKEYLVTWDRVRDDGLVLDKENKNIVVAKSAEEAVKSIDPGYDYYGGKCKYRLVDVKQI